MGAHIPRIEHTIHGRVRTPGPLDSAMDSALMRATRVNGSDREEGLDSYFTPGPIAMAVETGVSSSIYFYAARPYQRPQLALPEHEQSEVSVPNDTSFDRGRVAALKMSIIKSALPETLARSTLVRVVASRDFSHSIFGPSRFRVLYPELTHRFAPALLARKVHVYEFATNVQLVNFFLHRAEDHPTGFGLKLNLDRLDALNVLASGHILWARPPWNDDVDETCVKMGTRAYGFQLPSTVYIACRCGCKRPDALFGPGGRGFEPHRIGHTWGLGDEIQCLLYTYRSLRALFDHERPPTLSPKIVPWMLQPREILYRGLFCAPAFLLAAIPLLLRSKHLCRGTLVFDRLDDSCDRSSDDDSTGTEHPSAPAMCDHMHLYAIYGTKLCSMCVLTLTSVFAAIDTCMRSGHGAGKGPGAIVAVPQVSMVGASLFPAPPLQSHRPGDEWPSPNRVDPDRWQWPYTCVGPESGTFAGPGRDYGRRIGLGNGYDSMDGATPIDRPVLHQHTAAKPIHYPLMPPIGKMCILSNNTWFDTYRGHNLTPNPDGYEENYESYEDAGGLCDNLLSDDESREEPAVGPYTDDVWRPTCVERTVLVKQAKLLRAMGFRI